MKVIRNIVTKQVQCYWDDMAPQPGPAPVPRPGVDELVDVPGAAPADLDAAAAQSAGAKKAGVMYLRDSVAAATRSNATPNKGVKVGNKGVEAAAPDASGHPLIGPLMALRRAAGKGDDQPVTLNELMQAVLNGENLS